MKNKNEIKEFVKIKKEFQKKEKEFWDKKDLEFKEYSDRIQKIMWRGVGIFGLIVFVAVLLWGIVNK
jgi:hypothetical protein